MNRLPLISFELLIKFIKLTGRGVYRFREYSAYEVIYEVPR